MLSPTDRARLRTLAAALATDGDHGDLNAGLLLELLAVAEACTDQDALRRVDQQFALLSAALAQIAIYARNHATDAGMSGDLEAWLHVQQLALRALAAPSAAPSDAE